MVASAVSVDVSEVDSVGCPSRSAACLRELCLRELCGGWVIFLPM